MASALLVYGSWTGSTAGIARTLSHSLTDNGMRVFAAPAGSAPDPSAYDVVVVGSAVRFGEWHPTVSSWLAKHANTLQQKPLAVFSVCLTPACHPERAPEARGYAVALTLRHGLRPLTSGVFTGTFDPARLSLADRTRARLWGAKAGDYVDPGSVQTWAREVAELAGD